MQALQAISPGQFDKGQIKIGPVSDKKRMGVSHFEIAEKNAPLFCSGFLVKIIEDNMNEINISQLTSRFSIRAENREKALMTISWIGSAKFLPGRTASYFLDLYKPRQWRRSRPLSKLTRAAPTEEGTGGLAEVLASFWK